MLTHQLCCQAVRNSSCLEGAHGPSYKNGSSHIDLVRCSCENLANSVHTASQAVRDKRTPSAKDKLPEEVFLRLRGSLFFGPSFLVTRNKLSFRDNLQQLLADASPGEWPLKPIISQEVYEGCQLEDLSC